MYAALESANAAHLLERVKRGVVQVRNARRGGAGSGIVWNDRVIVTNHHVVARNERVKVVTVDGRELEARVLDTDPHLDLAKLEVNETLEAVPIADSRGLRVGELVFAVGHPWGQPWFATAGIVSGLGEVDIPGARAHRDLIRSDVQLRPGNSGGALVNAQGEVVGVNSMVWSGDLGVAVPSHVAQAWLERGETPVIGVGVQPVTVRRGLEAETRLMIVQLEPNGPAAKAGLQIGDVLLDANGKLLRHGDALLEALRESGKLELQVLRAESVRVVLVEPEPRKRAA